MNPKQYNELKEKIIEAVPDIMKLKSGCKIVNDLGFEDIIGSFKGLQELETLADRKIIKIIGRPITLEDVLVAIDEADLWNEYNEKASFMVNENGLIECDLYNWEEEPVFWKPNIPLQDQPEETKQLLYNLLCKK
jgi:hypothetical protein